MKKYLILLLFLLLLIPSVFSSDPIIRRENYLGNSHSYSVTFDGEGDATIIAKLDFQNTQQIDLTNIKLEIPGNNIRIINIVQQYYGKQQTCAEYDYNPSRCIRYEERQSYNPNYVSVNYTKETLSTSTVLNVKLTNAIKSQQQTTILIYYKTDNYVIKNNDLFKFNFETIKSPIDIETTRVGISVNEGLYLKEGKSKTNYQHNLFVGDLLTKTSFSAAESLTMQDNLYYIGSGQYVKITTSLDPYESFSVKGEYSDSWIAINLWKFLVIALSIIISIGILILIILKLIQVLKEQNELIKVISSGAIFAFLSCLIWGLFAWLANNYYSWFGHRGEMFLILIFLILCIASLIILFGPAIYFATKYKAVYSLWYIGSFLIILIIIAIFLLGFSTLFSTPRYK